MRIRVLSKVEVEAGGAEGADAVISIRGSNEAIEPELHDGPRPGNSRREWPPALNYLSTISGWALWPFCRADKG